MQLSHLLTVMYVNFNLDRYGERAEVSGHRLAACTVRAAPDRINVTSLELAVDRRDSAGWRRETSRI